MVENKFYMLVAQRLNLIIPFEDLKLFSNLDQKLVVIIRNMNSNIKHATKGTLSTLVSTNVTAIANV